MANYLFTVWPFAGHLHPALAIAHALQARGHQVAFYTGGSARLKVQGEGFRFFPFRKVNEEHVTDLVSTEFAYSPKLVTKLRRAKDIQRNFREWLLDTIPPQVDDIEDALAQWHADVLICDSAFWSPLLVFHETRQIPVAVLSVTAACVLPGPQAPAWGQGKPRPRTGISRLGATATRTLVRWLSAGFRAEVNAMRQRYSLPALRCSVTEFAAQMPLYLVPSTPEFDYNRTDLPSSVHYVGPCLWDKSGDAPPPAWLAQLPANQPLIYVTEATIGKEKPFLLRTAAIAFRDQPVQVVMTTGSQREATELDLGPPAPNLRIETYVPQSDLLPKTSVMVTLGGSGGVIAALRAGVPLVIVPTEWDRPENAQRVVEAGAGLRIAFEECTPERLRSAVERVLTESSFRHNAQRLANAFTHYGGPPYAAKLLEKLVPGTTNQIDSDAGGFVGKSLVSEKVTV